MNDINLIFQEFYNCGKFDIKMCLSLKFVHGGGKTLAEDSNIKVTRLQIANFDSKCKFVHNQ